MSRLETPPCSVEACDWLARLGPRELTYVIGAATRFLAQQKGVSQEQIHRELAIIAAGQPGTPTFQPRL